MVAAAILSSFHSHSKWITKASRRVFKTCDNSENEEERTNIGTENINKV